MAKSPFAILEQRRSVIAGALTPPEHQAVLAAFEAGGFRNISQAVRSLALAYADRADVRATVAKWFKANVERA